MAVYIVFDVETPNRANDCMSVRTAIKAYIRALSV